MGNQAHNENGRGAYEDIMENQGNTIPQENANDRRLRTRQRRRLRRAHLTRSQSAPISFRRPWEPPQYHPDNGVQEAERANSSDNGVLQAVTDSPYHSENGVQEAGNASPYHSDNGVQEAGSDSPHHSDNGVQEARSENPYHSDNGVQEARSESPPWQPAALNTFRRPEEVQKGESSAGNMGAWNANPIRNCSAFQSYQLISPGQSEGALLNRNGQQNSEQYESTDAALNGVENKNSDQFDGGDAVLNGNENQNSDKSQSADVVVNGSVNKNSEQFEGMDEVKDEDENEVNQELENIDVQQCIENGFYGQEDSETPIPDEDEEYEDKSENEYEKNRKDDREDYDKDTDGDPDDIPPTGTVYEISIYLYNL
ncbi:unnamed protein product [Larinioides sclopetarius]|uniref:Uncharacterized protein n=1 Tax=Larinioides sclopetarius TaxID=280406 RepID=A0AAV1Z9Q8_9ARAC